MVFKYPIFPALIIALVSVLGLFWVSETMNIVLVFIPAVIISFLVFMIASRGSFDSFNGILPLYLLAVGIQMIHLLEEFLTGFYIAMPALFGDEPYPLNLWLGFNLVACFIFITGGIALVKRLTFMYIIVIFFVLFGLCFNGLAHLLTSIYLQDYFPGLYTAIIYLILGPLMIRILLKPSSPV